MWGDSTSNLTNKRKWLAEVKPRSFQWLDYGVSDRSAKILADLSEACRSAKLLADLSEISRSAKLIMDLSETP